VLNLFCSDPASPGGSGDVEKKRKLILNYFANSDLESDEIIHYCPNCCSSPEVTMNHFLGDVTCALLPRAMSVIQRKNWVGQAKHFDWVGMLSSFWNLHLQVLLKFTGSPQKPVEAAEAGLNLEALGDDAEWADLLGGAGQKEDDQDDLEADPEDEFLGPPGTATAGAGDLEECTTWADFNRNCKKKAGMYHSSEHFYEQFVITRTAMIPGLTLLHKAIHLSSDLFDSHQSSRAAAAKPVERRILEAVNGTSIAECFGHVEALLQEPPGALPLSKYTRYSRSLLFRLLSALVCSLEVQLRRVHRGFPYQIFSLLDSGGPRVYHLPECFRDDFAKYWFQRYPTAEAAQHPDAQALLSSLCALSELDIMNIEVGHSSVREFTMQRGRGNTPSLTNVASRCLCRWIGKVFGYAKAGNKKKGARTDAQNNADTENTEKKIITGRGGGPWGAFVSAKSKNMKLNRDLIKTLSAQYRELDHDEWQHYKEMAELAALARKVRDRPYFVQGQGVALAGAAESCPKFSNIVFVTDQTYQQ
jgi:hypothetical protein